MSLKRICIVAAIACSVTFAAVSRAAGRAGSAIAAFGLAVVRLLAAPPNWRLVTYRIADVLNLPRRAYAGPPGGLRFESGRPTLAAARNI